MNVFNTIEAAHEHVRKIFKKIDPEGSGEIYFTEWVVATIDREILLTSEKLKAAFQLFDDDGGGTVNAAEVKEVLCPDLEGKDDIFDQIIRELDNDGDGEINLDEFSKMMRNIILK
jgi:calcium-dependent protein kinase